MTGVALALFLTGTAHGADLSPGDQLIAEQLAAWVVTTCGAEQVDVEWLGLRADLLPSHSRMVFSGDPCSPRPAVRVDLYEGERSVGYRNLWPRLAVSPCAERGDEVVLRVRRGDLVVEAPGRLIADAAVGGSAKVANLATDSVLEGTLIDASTVELR